MAQGGYDHPSYLTRQMIPLGTQAAGAGTSARRTFPSDMRVRRVVGVVVTAGTQTAWNATILNGTSSIGTISFGGTAAVGALGTSGDCNSTLTAGSVLSISTLLEATGVATFTAEMHLDPAATWS